MEARITELENRSDFQFNLTGLMYKNYTILTLSEQISNVKKNRHYIAHTPSAYQLASRVNAIDEDGDYTNSVRIKITFPTNIFDQNTDILTLKNTNGSDKHMASNHIVNPSLFFELTITFLDVYLKTYFNLIDNDILTFETTTDNGNDILLMSVNGNVFDDIELLTFDSKNLYIIILTIILCLLTEQGSVSNLNSNLYKLYSLFKIDILSDNIYLNNLKNIPHFDENKFIDELIVELFNNSYYWRNLFKNIKNILSDNEYDFISRSSDVLTFKIRSLQHIYDKDNLKILTQFINKNAIQLTYTKLNYDSTTLEKLFGSNSQERISPTDIIYLTFDTFLFL